jgi:hypothetical protein
MLPDPVGPAIIFTIPSPYSHRQLVIVPSDWSVNWTVSGTIPDVGDAEKYALSAKTGWISNRIKIEMMINDNLFLNDIQPSP